MPAICNHIPTNRGPGSETRRWCIRVRPATHMVDAHGRDLLDDVERIGLTHIQRIGSSKVYLLEGRLTDEAVRLIAEELLTDPVAEQYECMAGLAERSDSLPAIEVHPQPGVMNPPALSALNAIRRLLRAKGEAGTSVEQVQIGRRYEVMGARTVSDLEQIAGKVLANDCIENWYIQGLGRNDAIPDFFPRPPESQFSLGRVALRTLDDDGLAKLSRDGHLFLTIEEMKVIRGHFAMLGRDPTDLELETFAQTWSEHCVHKTLKSAVRYVGEDFGRLGPVEIRFDNLLKETIVAATQALQREWCLSVFVDNAGVMAFDEEYGIAFKVETHNHPSAIEPYGGAATGVGGCIRDIMGCGLGAKPIASTDVFCLASPDFDERRLPKDVLHPRRVLKGVVSGVRDYGNRMGIPTVNGAIYFDDRYLANPLVFCGCVGLIPRDRIRKQAGPGDRIVLAGGRTGRDGIHGATFSSAELTDTHANEFAHAVQIGNAIEEKKLLDAQLLARDHAEGCLYSCVTDCGAGGLSSAVGEMAAQLGAVVDLENVPLKYSGLRYDEIWISEAQERMVFAVPPERLDAFLKVFSDEEVEAAVIGTFTDDHVLRVRFRGETVGELDLRFLHEGPPKSLRLATWTAQPRTAAGGQPSSHQATQQSLHANKPPCHQHNRTSHEPPHSVPPPLQATQRPRRNTTSTATRQAESGKRQLLDRLQSLNVASKEWVIRQYDHEVQGRSVIKPLMGPGGGPSDAAVLRPRLDRYRGIAIGCGLCPHRTDADPYWMAVAAVDEALRNVICVGADPQQTAILDNFCWPAVESSESLGRLVRACKGASDAALAFGLPFISGKDSLNNEYAMHADEALRTGLPTRLAIPGTLLISSLGIVADVRRSVSMDLKKAGNCLVLASAPVEDVGFPRAYALHRRVAGLVADGAVESAHDVSDGGLATALAEMCIGSCMGARLALPEGQALWDAFAELSTSYVLEMPPASADASGLPVIGRVDCEAMLRIEEGAHVLVELPVPDATAAWRLSVTHRLQTGATT